MFLSALKSTYCHFLHVENDSFVHHNNGIKLDNCIEPCFAVFSLFLWLKDFKTFYTAVKANTTIIRKSFQPFLYDYMYLFMSSVCCFEIFWYCFLNDQKNSMQPQIFISCEVERVQLVFICKQKADTFLWTLNGTLIWSIFKDNIWASSLEFFFKILLTQRLRNFNETESKICELKSNRVKCLGR